MVFILIVALLFAIAAVIFALENPNMVTVTFLGYPAYGSIALVVLIAVGFGLLTGILVMLPSVIKRSVVLSKQRKLIAELENSIESHQTAISDKGAQIEEETAETIEYE
ncbi:MAG: LapA family protein [Anaerolineales bacterium]|nr:LapA family protein [Anaerolineales bacterium]